MEILFHNGRIYLAPIRDNLKQPYPTQQVSTPQNTSLEAYIRRPNRLAILPKPPFLRKSHKSRCGEQNTVLKAQHLPCPQLSHYFPTFHSWTCGIRASDKLSPATRCVCIPCWGMIFNNEEHHLA